MRKTNIASLAALIAVAACRPAGDRADAGEGLAKQGVAVEGPTGKVGDPVARAAENSEVPANIDQGIEPPPPQATTSESPLRTLAPEDEGQVPTIPASLQGRWGLVSGDCTSTRGDAKGLIIVGKDSIRYYEALAKPVAVTRSTETSFGGNFAVSGEGSEWTRALRLDRTGNKLTVDDVYEGGGKLTYTRCP